MLSLKSKNKIPYPTKERHLFLTSAFYFFLSFIFFVGKSPRQQQFCREFKYEGMAGRAKGTSTEH